MGGWCLHFCMSTCFVCFPHADLSAMYGPVSSRRNNFGPAQTHRYSRRAAARSARTDMIYASAARTTATTTTTTATTTTTTTISSEQTHHIKQIRPHRRCKGRDHPDGISQLRFRFIRGGGHFLEKTSCF